MHRCILLASYNICSLRPTQSVVFVLSQTILSLTKFIEKNINIYDTKYICYENIFYGEPNDTYLVSYTLILFCINVIKLEMV
uniref:Uncharacterized protein n=1 Tax=Arundo donax TaxID=35708 RepID=A0A0A9ETY0_ARUDO